jgi:phosphatidylglycerol:prolipoprotein diacylglycerol transferase
MLGYINFPKWITPEIIPGVEWLSWLRWYGLMYIVAFAIAYMLFKYQAKEKSLKIDDNQLGDFFMYSIIGMIIFARIFATIIYNDDRMYYLTNPWMIFWPYNAATGTFGFQGMSYHGGLLGVVVGAIVYAKVKKIDLLLWGDMVAAGVPLGYTFGRIANFINGELWGRVTDMPWAVVFPAAPQFRISEPWVAELANKLSLPVVNGMVNLPRHPSQLYEAFGEGILLWLILWFVLRNRDMIKGFMIASYVAGYGIIRFIIEYYREPDDNLGFVFSLSGANNPDHLTRSLLDFSTGQVLSFIMVVVAGVLYYAFYLNHKNTLAKAEEPEQKKNQRALRKKLKK